MAQKDQILGTNSTCGKDNDEAPRGQKHNRPEEFISFLTSLIQTDQDIVGPTGQRCASIVSIFQYAGGVIGKLFFITAAWKL